MYYVEFFDINTGHEYQILNSSTYEGACQEVADIFPVQEHYCTFKVQSCCTLPSGLIEGQYDRYTGYAPVFSRDGIVLTIDHVIDIEGNIL